VGDPESASVAKMKKARGRGSETADVGRGHGREISFYDCR
jgi:hypothetical protein